MDDLEISVTVAVNIFERKSVEKMGGLGVRAWPLDTRKSLGVICIVPARRREREERSNPR